MNKCFFTGRLGKDAETIFAANGTAITKFSLAVDCGWGDNKRTEWINCIVFKREKLGAMLTKGKAVIVAGEYSTNKWEDNEGNKRERVELICNDVEFQNGNSDNQQGGQQQSQQGGYPQQPANGQLPAPAQEPMAAQRQQQGFHNPPQQSQQPQYQQQTNNGPFTNMEEPPF